MNRLRVASLLVPLFLLTGCHDLKRMVGLKSSGGNDVMVADSYTNLRAIILDEAGITTVDDPSDVIALSRWTRAKLDSTQTQGQNLLASLAPQKAPRYFNEYVAEDDITQITSFCQKNSLSLGEMLALYGIYSADIHYIDVPTGAGLHQFLEYRLRGIKGIIDPYYGAVYVEGGQPVSLARMRAQRAALNDADLAVWINSVTIFYMVVPHQALHDVRLDWIVGTFVGGVK